MFRFNSTYDDDAREWMKFGVDPRNLLALVSACLSVGNDIASQVSYWETYLPEGWSE